MKINEKYKPLFSQNPTRYTLLTGGRGSGKSYSANLALVNLTYTPGHKFLFTRYTMVSANVSIIPEFLAKIELLDAVKDFRITKDEIINLKTGSSILFRGIKTSSGNQTANLKSLEGLTGFILDEAEELVSEDLFDKIDLSVRSISAPNFCWLIMNPTTKDHWIYKRFIERAGVQPGTCTVKDDTTYIHTDYRDNKDNLPEGTLRSIFRMKLEDPTKYDHVILGGWKEKADGVIFTNWDYGDFRMTNRHCFGQDYGYSNDPTTLLELSIDESQRNIYMRSRWGAPNLSAREIAKKNLQHAGQKLIVADSPDPRLIDELKGFGCNIKKAKKGAGSIMDGINLMQDFNIIVPRTDKALIYELNHYAWHSNGQKPEDKNNHYIDAARYAFQRLYTKSRSGIYTVR